MASSTDLSAFKNHGGKLLIVHGVSDPVFSINDTISWWNDVNRANNGAASDFTQVIRGSGDESLRGRSVHGPIRRLHGLDELGRKRLRRRIGSSLRRDRNSPWPGRTRPLCAYPKQARYKGSGSIEDASNFVCQ